MALIFECIHTDGIAELSYLVGDDSAGVAAVLKKYTEMDDTMTTGKLWGV